MVGIVCNLFVHSPYSISYIIYFSNTTYQISEILKKKINPKKKYYKMKCYKKKLQKNIKNDLCSKAITTN